jgi:soluble lytic murein transglycosylase-like protein
LNYFDNIINKASSEFGVDEKILKSVILAESAANPRAVSPVGAKGLMQLMDATAGELGVENSFDPQQNIMGGAKYLSKMLRQYDGDLELSLAAYNAGPGAVNKHNGVPPFEETKNYISRIKGYLNYFNG